MMEKIFKFNIIYLEMESRFIGLPHTHTTLLKSLISRANLETGIVGDICYRDLIALLTITPAPGRKGAGVPSKETIRNYIKSIERECGEHFQVITEGQDLKFLFPELPRLFKNYFEAEPNKEYTKDKLIDFNEERDDLEVEPTTEVNREANIASFAVKNNIYINKHNKQTEQTTQREKKHIDENFYPSEETIQLAQTQGLSKVLNPAEITKFIHYNLANGCQWVDFNPIFIKWLEREREYSQLKQRNKQPTQGKARSRVNEYSTYTNSYESAMAAVLQANADACPPCSPSYTNSFDENESFSVEYLVAMATANRHIRPVVY